MIVLILLGFASASAGPDSLALGDSLYAHGCFYEAVTEYERYRFGHPNDLSARHRLIRAAARDGDFERSDRLLLGLPASGDTMAGATRYELGLGYLEHKQPERAQAEFTDLLSITDDAEKRQFLHRQIGWLEVEKGAFASAARYFDSAGDSALAADCRRIHLPGRDATTAVLMSSFVPGSGEFYAGSIRLGAGSLLINGGLAAAIIYSFSRRHYLDAGLLFSLLWTRFYSGSRSNARDLTGDFNRRVRDEAARDLKRRWANEHQGRHHDRP